MILTFSDKRFPNLILQKVKIHTIREDKSSRWRIGNKIEFWMHNPRNVNLHPYQFATSHLREKKPILIHPELNKVTLDNVLINTVKGLNSLAVNDGFENWDHMKTWFSQPFSGYLLVWSQEWLRPFSKNKRNMYYAKQQKLDL